MKRTLEDLQKQYSKTASGSAGGRMMGPGGPRRGGPHASGKPKNTSATVKRLFSYIA